MLAANDLRDALVAHVEYPRDVRHREAVFVRLADGPVAIPTEPLGESAKVCVAAAVLLGKGAQAGASLW